MFWGLDETDYAGIAVVGLGKQGLGINKLEEIHEGKESVRAAAAGNPHYLKYTVHCYSNLSRSHFKVNISTYWNNFDICIIINIMLY